MVKGEMYRSICITFLLMLLSLTGMADTQASSDEKQLSHAATPTKERMLVEGNEVIEVNIIRLEGNEAMDRETLFRAIPSLPKLLGEKVTLGVLNRVADDITRYYRENGYLVAYAYIPAQDFDAGVVTIVVLEGRLAGIDVTSVAGYDSVFLERKAKRSLCGDRAPGCAGVAITQTGTERVAGLISDLPGIATAMGVLSPGDEVGSSTYKLKVTPGSVWVASLGLDNHGNRYTGAQRAHAGLQLNNAAGLGDRVELSLVTSGRGLVGGFLDASLPVGDDGWRTGFTWSRITYLLGEEYKAINSSGVVDAIGAYASYPIVRSVASDLNLRLAYENKQISDTILDETRDKRADLASLGLYGSHLDAWPGGVTEARVVLSSGRLGYGGTVPQEGGFNVAGGFSKLAYALSRDQTLAYLKNSRLSAYVAVRGQISDVNLDASEKFGLGGPSGVRAYPAGEALGDIGHIVSYELRLSTPLAALGANLGLAVFYDEGRLQLNHTPWQGANGPTQRYLAGWGVGLSLVKSDAYSLKFIGAARDRQADAATSDSDAMNRFWLLANYRL